jgi:DNA-binding response OmpR family regulator
MKVLIVEDEHRIAQNIKKGLELKSFVVDLAFDGQEGYDLASSEKYDVIILDRMLPNKDGLEICRQIRSEGNHTPVLMLTAKNEISDRVDGLDCGADDYLGKPFAFVELLARLNALARRPHQSQDPRLKIDDLILDTVNFQANRAGQPLNLSKKEFALLEFFIRHPGRVFNKDQLIEQVWDYDSSVLANTAQVYIGYLRQKVDKDFPGKNPLIHTIRGFGYRFGSK